MCEGSLKLFRESRVCERLCPIATFVVSPQAAGPPKDGDAAEKTEDNQLAALARRFEEKYGVRIGQGERHGCVCVKIFHGRVNVLRMRTVLIVHWEFTQQFRNNFTNRLPLRRKGRSAYLKQ